jgi:anti-anti-sigma regulatory factor
MSGAAATPAAPPSPALARGATVTLPERLSIAEARSLHAGLAAALADGAPVVLDAAQVTVIDTACLQLLLALWRDAGDGAPSCEWAGVSPALRQAATLVGLERVLQLPDEDVSGGPR